jgi:hypothetical protein
MASSKNKSPIKNNRHSALANAPATLRPCYKCITYREKVMEELHERKDHDTEEKVREAIAMKTAFGTDVARTFLKMRGIDSDLTERVLKAPPEQLRR